jgi:diguanylate cyclase (GGDEF)-like protein
MIDRRERADRRLAQLNETNARLRRQLAEQESFWRIAHQDALTGLWNRRYADVRLAEEIGRARSVPGYRFSVLVADVDDLKGVNDRQGHAAGDQALRWVAGFLSRSLRADDVCCRIGGDEFLVILPACGVDECRRFVKRVRARWHVEAQARERAGAWTVAVSLGTASYPAHGATAEALCAVADGAMYEEKRRGGSRTTRSLSTEATVTAPPSAAWVALARKKASPSGAIPVAVGPSGRQTSRSTT